MYCEPTDEAVCACQVVPFQCSISGCCWSDSLAPVGADGGARGGGCARDPVQHAVFAAGQRDRLQGPRGSVPALGAELSWRRRNSADVSRSSAVQAVAALHEIAVSSLKESPWGSPVGFGIACASRPSRSTSPQA